MDHDKHRQVPVGTVVDDEGQPRTIKRDYDHAVIGGWTLSLAAVEQLEELLPQLKWDMLACRAEMIAESAGDEDGLCVGCGEKVTLLGGQWTAWDGTIACTDTSAAYVLHKPATEARNA